MAVHGNLHDAANMPADCRAIPKFQYYYFHCIFGAPLVPHSQEANTGTKVNSRAHMPELIFSREVCMPRVLGGGMVAVESQNQLRADGTVSGVWRKKNTRHAHEILPARHRKWSVLCSMEMFNHVWIPRHIPRCLPLFVNDTRRTKGTFWDESLVLYADFLHCSGVALPKKYWDCICCLYSSSPPLPRRPLTARPL
jgi:hypothetical protein